MYVLMLYKVRQWRKLIQEVHFNPEATELVGLFDDIYNEIAALEVDTHVVICGGSLHLYI